MKFWMQMLLYLPIVGIITQYSQKYYVKVNGPFPLDIYNCFLSNMSHLLTRTGCALACSSRAECHLACAGDKTCHLFSALISPRWNGSALNTFANTSDMECFSSWAHPEHLTDNLTFTGSGIFAQRYDYNKIVDGFYCGDDVTGYYHSSGVVKSWIQIQLPYLSRIDSIKLMTRDFQDTTYFKDVEIRIGNMSSNGNFSKNKIFGNYEGPAALGDILDFNPAEYIAGKFISLQIFGNNFLIVGQIMITGRQLN